MKVKIKTKGLEPGKRLDLKKVDTWSLWDGDTLLEEKVPIPDAGLGLDHYKCIVNDEDTVSVVRFADLHRHSDNSLRDGILKVPDMVKHTEYAGALTDHGNLYGFVEYYNAMKGAGKKPIIGMEAYQENLRGELSGNHLILLAKNDVGYKNLIKLSSESFEHFYRKPHITWEMLKQYHEGIICTTACLGGLIPKSFANGDRESAYYAAKQLLKIFGEDFYIEIQRHEIREELAVNRELILIAKELGLKVVATTDAHYPTKEDAYPHEILLCIQTGKTLTDEGRMGYDGTGYWLMNSEEVEDLFSDMPEILDNTLDVADKCDVTLNLGDVNLPAYTIPKRFETPMDYMEHLTMEGYDRHFKGTPLENDPIYRDRLKYELDMIRQMGFASYFIIVWDFINYCRTHNIYVGPGRGSAAGSLVAYCLGITDLDPIKYKLLFERFLNPERVSWPD